MWLSLPRVSSRELQLVERARRQRDRYRFTVMADVYNLLNANPETDFITTTGSDYRNIVEWLPGRTFQVGLRFQF